LVVDDDHTTLELLETYLGRAGFQVITAKDGSEAVTMAVLEMPQLILLDILLPSVGGVTALKQLKSLEITKAIPVIVITAGGQVGAEKECEQNGAAAFMIKPLSPAELLAEINALLK
jgi:DNA-binding response OmpR family regulator